MSGSRLTQAVIDQSVAIVGMACRFPGASSPAKLWKILREGKEAVRFFSARQLIQAGHDPGLVNRPDYVRAYGMLGGIGDFDADFFGFTQQEAEITDPQHRLFLECAWEALEQAGYVAEQVPGVIGVFGGAGGGESYYLNHLHPHRDLRNSIGAQRLQLCNDKDYLAARVAYHLNLTGPAVTVQTACSTSLAAVVMGYQSLLDYQSDLVLAGGVNINVPEITGYRYQKELPYSPDGHCRAFDANAKGAAPGNGVGVVAMKRLGDALRDGDFIHAVVRGAALAHDGGRKPGFTLSSVDGQARAMHEALALADMNPEDLTYLEAHGSGQPLADAIEIAALTKAFRGTSDATQTCALGSVKTNLGNLHAAAGIAGLLKTVLALYYRQLPPSLHFQTPHPRLELEESPFFVNAQLRDWDAPRRAGVNAYGLGGANAHVILEEAPPRKPSAPCHRSHLLVLSAQTPKALTAMRSRLAKFLEGHPDLAMADVIYTLQQGRKAFPFRFCLVGRESPDFIQGLRLPDIPAMQALPKMPPLIFYFPSGNLPVNTGETLYRREKMFRTHFDRCADWVMEQEHWDMRLVLFPSGDFDRESATQSLNRSGTLEVILFSLEYALAQQWMHWGIQPQAMAGGGVGEIVAHCLNRLYTLEESLGLMLSSQRPLIPPETTLSPNTEAVMITYPQAIVLEIGPNPDPALLAEQLGHGRVILPTLPPPDEPMMEESALLNTLGQLWLYGVEVDWSALHANDRRQRLPLPTYPFERKHHWIDPPRFVYHG